MRKVNRLRVIVDHKIALYHALVAAQYQLAPAKNGKCQQPFRFVL